MFRHFSSVHVPPLLPDFFRIPLRVRVPPVEKHWTRPNPLRVLLRRAPTSRHCISTTPESGVLLDMLIVAQLHKTLPSVIHSFQSVTLFTLRFMLVDLLLFSRFFRNVLAVYLATFVIVQLIALIVRHVVLCCRSEGPHSGSTKSLYLRPLDMHDLCTGIAQFSTATGYMQGLLCRASIPYRVHTGSGDRPAFCPVGIGDSFPKNKATGA
jgi:hypothetical protein